MDDDLHSMSIWELQEEIIKLRTAIRTHRDQKGDDNCYFDDESYLYNILPEKLPAEPELTNKQLHMQNCSRYYDCRAAKKLYKPLESLPEKIDFSIDWIPIEKLPPPFVYVVVRDITCFDMCIAYNTSDKELKIRSIESTEIKFPITHWFPLPKG